METFINWLTENWELITFIALILINVVNALTKHFGEHAGVKKVLLFITEMLSLIASSGKTTTNGSKLKAPLTSAETNERE